MQPFIFLITLLILTPFLYAKDVFVFDVRKNLTMSDNDPVYRDYYINAGRNHGIRPGMMIAVTRRQALYDSYTNSSPGDLSVLVGKVKIIQASDTVSVARLVGLVSHDKIPILDVEAIMIGDHLEVGTAQMDRGPKEGESNAPTEAPTSAPKPAAQITLEPEGTAVKPLPMPEKSLQNPTI